MKTCILPFALSILLAAAAHAELKWQQTTVEVHPAIGDKQAVAHFKYENVGKTPVHFRSVRASCGCTTARTQQNQVNPGDKGEITATFNIGGRTGMQMKTVTVQTDDPDPKRAVTILTLKADIPQLLTIQPVLVYWQTGEEAKPKTIIVKTNQGLAITKLDVTSSSPSFTTKVAPGSASGEFLITVQPHDTDRAAFGAITIRPNYPNYPSNVFYATARVMPKPGPPAPAPPVTTTGSVMRRPTATPAAKVSPSVSR
jgi:Protein of unknown function (DUF1573)